MHLGQKIYTNIRAHSSSMDGSQPIPWSAVIASLSLAYREEDSCTMGGFCSIRCPQMLAAFAVCVAQFHPYSSLRREALTRQDGAG